MAIIESVLIQRAPELGLTLRRQVALAISEEASKAGYDPLLIVALIDVESDFQEDAVSEKGARGLMQIRPSTLHFLARREGLRLSRDEVAADPALCVRLGIRYLRDLNDRLGHLDLALMAYNAGPSRIRQAMREGGLEPFLRYPRLVRRDFRRFREGQGLGGDWAWAQREESE
ncbi:MAG TPA: lytic transglycosylase domain-containing protein [Myxococcaceae bacterium]|nr:lytic transglycosylase domain-containing protein [Myxococcaceae bacterium]